MSSFIDRDPKKMMSYAKNVETVINEMTLLIRKVEGVLDSYAKDLDGPTLKQIDELHKCCNEYLKQIEVYDRIAKSVYDKGKKLNNIRNGV